MLKFKNNRLDLDHSFIVECRDGIFMVPKNDQYVGKSLISYGEFSHLEFDIFQKLILPHFNILEIGANLGAHTVPLAKICNRIVAIEPQPFCFKYLQSNVYLNNLDNAKCYNLGFSDVTKSMWVPTPTNAITNFGGISLQDTNVGVEVTVIPGNMIQSHDGPFEFIKIDVEGMELEVLKGLDLSYGPILYMENDRVEKSHDLIEYCWAQGYSLYWHTPLLYNPHNFNKNKDNVFGNIASFNMVCFPKQINVDNIGLPKITENRHPLQR